jgi:hypothetical protein
MEHGHTIFFDLPIKKWWFSIDLFMFTRGYVPLNPNFFPKMAGISPI